MLLYNDIKHVLPEFQFEGKYRSVEELHSGNINFTYHLIYQADEGERHYTLQYINSYVFKEPAKVMHNIERVTGHLRDRLIAERMDPKRHVLELIPSRSGETLFRDAEGGFWRAYHFIENATAYDQVREVRQFFEAGRGFGMFQRRLFDFPAEELYETIPGFHHTTKRFYAFVQSVAEDKAGRVAELEDEIEFFFERRRMMGQIVKLLAEGKLPVRVTHNDTKVNNVMIDDVTGEAICVIDLDTVMPGSSLYDYGDAIRFGASTAAEDEPDTSKIALDMEKFEQFTRGFFQETKGFLTKDEPLLMPLGAKVMACELAMRFLKDYIDGDLYFKVKSPEHNLVRARAQMKLLTDIEEKYDRMTEFVEKLTAE
jgi:Ser/Thr protein kinase RdoA (MazF antagonist)